jgi:tetratricopeptide (TPR) repeat protein
VRRLLTLLLLLPAFAVAGAWEDGINQAARLHKRGKLKAAEAKLLELLYTAEGYGESDPRLAYTLDYLGTLDMQLKQADKAAPVLERAVRAFKASRGEKAQETLESSSRLAEAYESLGDYAKAEPLYRILVESGRGEALQQSADLNNWALSLDAQGKMNEALPLYKKALELRERSQGSMGEGLAEILNNLGRVYYLQNEYVLGEEMYLRAIRIDEFHLKKGDPQLAEDHKRLDALRAKMKKKP